MLYNSDPLLVECDNLPAELYVLIIENIYIHVSLFPTSQFCHVILFELLIIMLILLLFTMYHD